MMMTVQLIIIIQLFVTHCTFEANLKVLQSKSINITDRLKKKPKIKHHKNKSIEAARILMFYSVVLY